jgi:hypothetical protein
MGLVEELGKQIREAEENLREAEEVLGIIRDAGRPSARDESRLKNAKAELERLKKSYEARAGE